MKSILKIIGDMRNLRPVPCKIGILEYDMKVGDNVFRKVAIYLSKYRKEVNKAVHDIYTPYCITMYKEQYELIFKPLFEDLGILNQSVKNIKNELD